MKFQIRLTRLTSERFTLDIFNSRRELFLRASQPFFKKPSWQYLTEDVKLSV